MAIQFSGLATGLDTSSIIDQLMLIEQAPITRLEADKAWMNNRLAAFTELNNRLLSFTDAIESLGKEDSLLKRSMQQSSGDFVKASVSSEALAGTSYQVEVVSLAQVQKSVSEHGFTSKESSSFGTGTLSIEVDGTTHSIEITEDNNSLEGIMQAINDADLGINAAIINDGSESPYRLMLAGDTVGQSFTMDGSGVTGGTNQLGVFEDETGLSNPPVQLATKAHVRLDSLDIYADSNTLTETIPGVTLELLQAQEGETTNLKVALDKGAIASTIEAFAEGYNEVISFITGQSVINKEGGGVLGGDSGINAIKRHLQDMLTTTFDNSGIFTTMSELGFETQKDGTLVVNNETLNKAIDANLDSVISLLTGTNEDGLAFQFQKYLGAQTSSTDGMLKGRKDSINTNIKRIDEQIESMGRRLEQRRTTLEAEFSAMETLVSSLNTQGSFLTQQMSMLSQLSTGKQS
ncbi:MAG: hypothetical protein CSA33_03100 [Desulfobulbus propionicus]|nr:MAG: hypothetical protein CSA33_03100 [Desulfobulbus propionicus]